MIVEIESVDNGFIVRQKNEEGDVVYVRSIDEMCSEEQYRKNECDAVVDTAYQVFEFLGFITSKHKPYNWRFLVVDKDESEVE